MLMEVISTDQLLVKPFIAKWRELIDTPNIIEAGYGYLYLYAV